MNVDRWNDFQMVKHEALFLNPDYPKLRDVSLGTCPICGEPIYGFQWFEESAIGVFHGDCVRVRR